jgi:hypothetical protein
VAADDAVTPTPASLATLPDVLELTLTFTVSVALDDPLVTLTWNA